MSRIFAPFPQLVVCRFLFFSFFYCFVGVWSVVYGSPEIEKSWARGSVLSNFQFLRGCFLLLYLRFLGFYLCTIVFSHELLAVPGDYSLVFHVNPIFLEPNGAGVRDGGCTGESSWYVTWSEMLSCGEGERCGMSEELSFCKGGSFEFFDVCWVCSAYFWFVCRCFMKIVVGG